MTIIRMSAVLLGTRKGVEKIKNGDVPPVLLPADVLRGCSASGISTFYIYAASQVFLKINYIEIHP